MIKKNLRVITILATISIISVTLLSGADMTSAVVSCAFTTVDKTMLLESDCFTDKTILVPDGFTLDGNGYIITAIDPSGGNYKGAIIQNAGEIAHVTNLKITVSNLENICDADDSRLRGIFFKESSGTITNNQIININQGTGNCKEGDAIVIENGPFDGTHPNTKTILIENNYIMNYQQTGIASSGDVNVSILHNVVGESALQTNLIANSIQVGFGATGEIIDNTISGNIWNGLDGASSAILIYYGDDVKILGNTIYGNSEIGIHLLGNNAQVENNRVLGLIDDASSFGDGVYHVGIANQGHDNKFTSNFIEGFQTPYLGV